MVSLKCVGTHTPTILLVISKSENKRDIRTYISQCMFKNIQKDTIITSITDDFTLLQQLNVNPAFPTSWEHLLSPSSM
jgi:hypothetical protein